MPSRAEWWNGGGASSPEGQSTSQEFDELIRNAISPAVPHSSSAILYPPVNCEVDRWLNNPASQRSLDSDHPALAATAAKVLACGDGLEAQCSEFDFPSVPNRPDSVVSGCLDESCGGDGRPGEDTVSDRIGGFFLLHFKWLLFALGLCATALLAVAYFSRPAKASVMVRMLSQRE